MQRGKLIIFEGGEGCGKGTHVKLFSNWLGQKEIKHFCTKEPGGNPAGEKIRKILLDKKENLDPLTELYLFCADRTEQYKQTEGKLEKGVWVVSDRSWPSTLAYQGTAGKVNRRLIEFLTKLTTKKIKPDLLYILDVDPKRGLEREVNPDRFADKGLPYHHKVRKGYLGIAEKYPEFSVIIPYIPNEIAQMQEHIRLIAKERLHI